MPSPYRTAITSAIADWELPPAALGTTWPSFRTKSETSRLAVAFIQDIMRRNPLYDDDLVEAVNWLLNRSQTVVAVTKLVVGSRLHQCLTNRLASNPTPLLNPKIRFQDISWFRYWAVEGSTPTKLLFSSHGYWNAKGLEGQGHPAMIRINYKYAFYCEPGASLSGSQYKALLPQIGSGNPDILAPGSGSVQNLLLQGLEEDLFTFTVKHFTDHVRKTNVRDTALIMVCKPGQWMTLDQIDKQLLPHLSWPTTNTIHMIVCRATKL